MPLRVLILCALLAASCAAPAAVISSPTPTATVVAPPSTQPVAPTAPSAYVNPTQGFSVVLPVPYRKSTRLSIPSTGGQRPAAVDAFTAWPEPDEAAMIARQGCETACPVWNYVAVINAFTGTGAQTPRDFYNAFSYSQSQTIEDLLVDGHQAVKVTNGPSYPVEYLIKDGDRMFMLGYSIYQSFDVPLGATRAKLDAIITSFKFVN